MCYNTPDSSVLPCDAEENRKIEIEREPYEDDLRDLESDLKFAKRELDAMTEPVLNVEEAEAEVKKVHAKRDELKDKLKEAEADLKEWEKHIETLKFWKGVFAANGMKAYIFKAMLDQLNQYTAKYGAKLGCSIRFSLDFSS